jgi:hypothetical protein
MSLQECLSQADRILACGEDELARQRLIVARLEQDRRAASMAPHVLETFEHIQSERSAMRNELLAAAAIEGMTKEAG